MELKEILRQVNRPARYINQEEGAVHKDWTKMNCRCALCFPDKYEIGMSNLGLEILYFLGNEIQNTVVERCYAPDQDLGELLKRNKTPLFSLESKTSLKNFDLLCFSVQYELAYTNILYMLDLARVPLLVKDRSEADPIVIIGGHCAYNPEPLASFVDIAIIGEGEECFPALLSELAKPELKDLKRSAKLEYLKKSSLKGLYFTDLKKEVKKCWIRDLNKLSLPRAKIIPNIDITHERAVVEIMRGCLHGCRFCQAGFIMRPLRAKSRQLIKETAELILKQTGYAELALLSLTASDHPEIDQLVKELNTKLLPEKVNISLPSLRTDSISEDLLNEIQKLRKTTITIAPEAGSQRLRDIIHKDMNEEDIIRAFKLAVSAGSRSIKLYFMIGLPGETENDIKGIANLANQLYQMISDTKHTHLTVSVSNFVPKSHTPFQWAKVDTPEIISNKQKIILSIIKRSIKVKFHDPEMSLIESILSRMNQADGELILLNIYRQNGIFSGWSENFKFEQWQNAFNKYNLDLAGLLKEIPIEQRLPWDNIKTGVPKGYLIKEWQKAKLLAV